MSGNRYEPYINSRMVRRRFIDLLDKGLYSQINTRHISSHQKLLEDEIRPAIDAFLGYYFNEMWHFNKTNSHRNEVGKTDIYIEKLDKNIPAKGPKIVVIAEQKKGYCDLTTRIKAPFKITIMLIIKTV